jgi:ATP-dependent Clp protease ATP-binding subunit ClpA
MIKSVQNRLKDKGINLIVDLSVQAFLTDEGYDPIYGARPLRRAIMKYLEDTLAEQCLSKTLYPNTKIHVRRKKVEGTLMTYTNELEVEIDFSDVDPNLLEESKES